MKVNLLEWIKNTVDMIKSKRLRRAVASSGEKIFIDLGASSIKAHYKGTNVNFRSSIREAMEDEIQFQDNHIKVNGKYYIYAENNLSTGTYHNKYQKENIEVLILCAMQKLNIVDIKEVQIEMLVPYNQLHTKDLLRKKINGTYNVNGKFVTLELTNLFIEGDCSKYYVETRYQLRDNVIIVNTGYSTIDIAFYNGNTRQDILSIQQGTNYLLPRLVKYSNAPNSNVLGTWLNEGYKFKSTSEVLTECIKYLNSILQDVYSIVRLANPDSTTVVLCGGGNMLLGEAMKKVFQGKYIILEGDEAIYTDLLGMVLLSTKESVYSFPDGYTNKQKVIDLKLKGIPNSEIAFNLSMSQQTVKNYWREHNRQVEIAE